MALASPVPSVAKIQTVYDHSARGDQYFNAQLRRELRQMGLSFVSDRNSADVILDSRGDDLKYGGFRAMMTLRDRAGRLVWRETVMRPPGSRLIAYEHLSDKLRKARLKDKN